MARVPLSVLLTALFYFVTIMGGASPAAALQAPRGFDSTLTLPPTAAGQPVTATFDGTNPVIDARGSCEAFIDKALLPATCVNTTGDVKRPRWEVGFTVPVNTQPGVYDVTVVANGDTATGPLQVLQPPVVVRETPADPVRVPNLLGSRFSVAQSLVQAAKLVLSQPATTIGTVATQQPVADTVVAAGSTITITMTGIVLVPVPDLIGRTTADARAALSTVGLRLRNGGGDPSRRVKAQNPKPGVNVAAGSPVSVTLQPLDVVLVPVPDLRGMTTDRARAALGKAHLVLADSPVNADNNAHVVGQSPVPGARVAPGTTVTVSLEVPTSSTSVGVPGIPLALVLAAVLGIVLVRRLRPRVATRRNARRGDQKAQRPAVHLVPRPDPAIEVKVLSSSDLTDASVGLAARIDTTTEPELLEVPR